MPPTRTGTIVSAGVTVGNSANAFPAHYADEGQGGLHSVATLQDRDAITTARRVEGMMCYVIADTKTYILKGGTANTDWEEFSSGIASETDPVFSGWNKSDGISITESQISDLQNYLTEETEPDFNGSAAAGIDSTDISNWDGKEVPLTFSDGVTRTENAISNSDKGSAAVSTHESTYSHSLIATALQSETDPVFTASAAAGITTQDISDWDSATTNSHSHANKEILDGTEESFTTALKSEYDTTVTWGDHASAGYVKADLTGVSDGDILIYDIATTVFKVGSLPEQADIAWEDITGDIADSTTLQGALDAKEEILTFSDGLERTDNNIINTDLGSAAVTGHTTDIDHSNFVSKTGNETIAGIKTFSDIPLLPDVTPTTDLMAVTKKYTDAIAAGFKYKDAVLAATTEALASCTYDNGTNGVGATLTSTTNNSFPAFDGYTANLNDRLLIKDETDPAHNGVFSLTQVGSGSLPWILTRTTDFNSDATIDPGSSLLVLNGTTQQATQWAQNASDPITVGTSDITFVQIAKPQIYQAGSGLALLVDTFSVDYDNSSIGIVSTKLAVKSLGITNAMLAGNIADEKLNQIATASKVSGSALTELANIPSAAGRIPIANIASGTPTGTKFVRDDGTLAVPEGSGGTGSGTVQTIVAGDNVAVDDTDPANPIVSANIANSVPRAEVPTGLINGTNKAYTLIYEPAYPSGTIVVINGVTQYYGSDYTVSGQTITFTTAPITGSTIFAYYNTFSSGGTIAVFSGLSKISVSVTEPSSPNVGDIWIDIS